MLCNCTPPRKLMPLQLLLEYWIEHVNIRFLYVNLYSQMGYSTMRFPVLQLIVPALFGAVDSSFAFCMLFGNRILNNSCSVSLRECKTRFEYFASVSTCIFVHIRVKISWYMYTLFFYLTYIHVSHIVAKYLCMFFCRHILNYLQWMQYTVEQLISSKIWPQWILMLILMLKMQC